MSHSKHNLPTIMKKMFVDFFTFLAQFLFITSESELGYYHQKVYIRVASRAVARLKS